MWFAKDGPRPHSQSGPGLAITTVEAQAIVGTHQSNFVGRDAPSFNRGVPSNSLKNVVIEIESSDEVCSLFPKVGFYFVADLTPAESQSKLSALRGQV